MKINKTYILGPLAVPPVQEKIKCGFSILKICASACTLVAVQWAAHGTVPLVVQCECCTVRCAWNVRHIYSWQSEVEKGEVFSSEIDPLAPPTTVGVVSRRRTLADSAVSAAWDPRIIKELRLYCGKSIFLICTRHRLCAPGAADFVFARRSLAAAFPGHMDGSPARFLLFRFLRDEVEHCEQQEVRDELTCLKWALRSVVWACRAECRSGQVEFSPTERSVKLVLCFLFFFFFPHLLWFHLENRDNQEKATYSLSSSMTLLEEKN